jgi:disulfide bond formation protein DsbB
MLTSADPRRSSAYRIGTLVLFSATAVILAALAFEHLGGYAACPLCLQQRYAYYAGIPLLFTALIAVAAEREPLAATLFALAGVGFVANAGLGGYHAGVEWGWWAGPETCAATASPLSTNTGDFLRDLSNSRVVRCDEASWRLLGLSFAGWNVIASLMLAGGAGAAAAHTLRR